VSGLCKNEDAHDAQKEILAKLNLTRHVAVPWAPRVTLTPVRFILNTSHIRAFAHWHIGALAHWRIGALAHSNLVSLILNTPQSAHSAHRTIDPTDR
jgi:hypothetical protein